MASTPSYRCVHVHCRALQERNVQVNESVGATRRRSVPADAYGRTRWSSAPAISSTNFNGYVVSFRYDLSVILLQKC